MIFQRKRRKTVIVFMQPLVEAMIGSYEHTARLGAPAASLGQKTQNSLGEEETLRKLPENMMRMQTLVDVEQADFKLALQEAVGQEFVYQERFSRDPRSEFTDSIGRLLVLEVTPSEKNKVNIKLMSSF